MIRFLPKEEKFFDMLAEAADNITEAAKILHLMVENETDLEENSKVIKSLEHKGDQITHEIINKLNQTFVTPFDREDIFDLCKALDDIIDYIDDASDRIIMFKIISFPEEAKRLTQILLSATEQLQQGIKQLQHLEKINPYCVEINRLENESDNIYHQGLVRLFADGSDPITIIKMKDFYDDLEMASDMCEDVANVLEAICVKNQ
ncbi:DUF47 domain-containing protein [candidate division KSB1 bacterium]|nr:DUF47 domain-containing protein [candidate division KSB1 bacterium]